MDEKWRKRIAYAIKAVAFLLKTPLINFEVKMPEIVEEVSKRLHDGILSDEDLADILTYIAEKIEGEGKE